MLSQPKMMTLIRALAIAWSAILLVVIGIGSFSKEHIGAMTWGPTSDIWAITVAISNMEYGLGGHLGYREVEQALDDRLTAQKNSINVNDERTRKLVNDPNVVTTAIRAAAALNKSTFAPARAEGGGYTVLAAEDTGLSDYYRWAFSLFGLDAYSTRYLYIAILAGSFFLFVVAYAQSNVAIALITLVVTALFLETTSAIFGPLLPSLSANRFLSTLAIIPFFHLLCAILDAAKFSGWRAILIFVQSILLASMISVRSSANWTLIALFLIGTFAILLDVRSSPRSDLASADGWKIFANLYGKAVLFLSLPLIFLRPIKLMSAHLRIVLIMLIIFGSAISVIVSDRFKTDKIYFTDELIGHHLVWHNPYIALTLHPDWPKVKPYPDQPDFLSDNVSWVAYTHAVDKLGISIGSPIFLIRYGLHDRIIRGEFLSFVVRHPKYAMELYFYYKVIGFFQTFDMLVSTIPRIVWFVPIASGLIASILFLIRPQKRQSGTMYYAILIAWASSLLPSFWAYSLPHVFSDQLLLSLFLILFTATVALSYVLSICSRNCLRGHSINHLN